MVATADMRRDSEPMRILPLSSKSRSSGCSHGTPARMPMRLDDMMTLLAEFQTEIDDITKMAI